MALTLSAAPIASHPYPLPLKDGGRETASAAAVSSVRSSRGEDAGRQARGSADTGVQ